MAHVISTLDRADPSKVVAVLPESWAHSQVDQVARSAVEKRYSIEVLSLIKNSTFQGARANAILVCLTKLAVERNRVESILDSKTYVHVIRGGLPVFEAIGSRAGVPFVHSTSLLALAEGTSQSRLPRVRPIGRGRVRGHVLLLPRVGVPKKQQVKSIFLRDRVQLSDCVIALQCSSRQDARQIQADLSRHFDGLSAVYKGTGARYVTVERLQHFLRQIAS
jgi:hypothetical protein